MGEAIFAVVLALLTGGIYFLGKKKDSSQPSSAATISGLTLEEKIHNEIKAISIRKNIPSELIVAQVKKESGGGTHIDKINATGSAGEIGLLQIKPVVLVDYNRANRTSWIAAKLWDWPFNLEVGTWYLTHLKARFGNWENALIAYNIGPTKFAEDGATPKGQSYASTILSWAGLV